MSIAFLPFPTAILGTYIHYRVAGVLYAVSIALAGLLLSLVWAYASHGGLVSDDLDPGQQRTLLIRLLAIPVIFLASVPIAMTGQIRIAAAMWIVLPPLIRAVLRKLHRQVVE